MGGTGLAQLGLEVRGNTRPKGGKIGREKNGTQAHSARSKRNLGPKARIEGKKRNRVWLKPIHIRTQSLERGK